MGIHVGVGLSRQSQDAEAAGKEAAQAAMASLKQDRADVFVVLCSSLFNQEEVLKGISSIGNTTPMVGCSTAGVLTNAGVAEHAIAVLAMQSDHVAFHPVKQEHISQGMAEAGRMFAEQLKQVSGPESLKLAFIFSDALSGNGTELVRGVLGALGSTFPLVGGAAGDDMLFKKTYQYYNGEVLTDAAVGLAVTGDVQYAVGADHGWQPIGSGRIVTKAEGTTLYELDGKPAFSIYEDYFGQRAHDFKQALSLAAVSYPLGMKTSASESYMIRVPLSVKDDGSIVCGAEVIQGSEVYLMIGTQSSALWAAKDTTQKLKQRVPSVIPSVIFVSDCVARKILFGERAREEIDAIRAIAGEHSQMFGFYSYGQIAPLGEREVDVKTCDPGFYEQSISLAIFGE